MRESRACGRRGSRLGPSGGESDPVERGFASRQGARTMCVGPGRMQGRAALAPAAPPCSGMTLARARHCPKTMVTRRHEVPPREGPAPRATHHCSRLGCQQEITAFYLDGFGLTGSCCSLTAVALPGVQRELPDVYWGAMAMCWVRAAASPAKGCGPSWLGGYPPRRAEEGAPSPVK